MSPDSTGLRVLVVGGTAGIGAEVAYLAATKGATVAVNGRSRSANVETLLERLRSSGQSAAFVPGDMTSEESIGLVMEGAVGLLGGLDAVIVSGRPRSTHPAPFLEAPPGTFIEHFREASVSRLFVVWHAAQHMRRAGGGSIVLITSDAGRTPTPSQVLTGASSAATLFATRVLALELARFQIRVNAIAVTLTRGTEQYERFERNAHEDPTFQRVLARIEQKAALGLASSQDVAECAWFLAAPSSSKVTGAIMSVNGGVSFP